MKIVFVGDSVTDVGKNSGSGSTVSIGQGYALIASSKLTFENPGKYTFINNGISGSKVVDLYARAKTDIWNERPDLLSVLVGVNDVWHEYAASSGVDAERYEFVLKNYILETRQRLPDIKIIMMEPFILNTGAAAENWDNFKREVDLRAGAVRRVAATCGCEFVPLQEKFEQACDLAPASYWIADGVHPTPAGHQLIARQWLAAFERITG